jgi:hypothetical protein
LCLTSEIAEQSVGREKERKKKEIVSLRNLNPQRSTRVVRSARQSSRKLGTEKAALTTPLLDVLDRLFFLIIPKRFKIVNVALIKK